MAALWMAAPRFTADDEREERRRSSESELSAALDDLYGSTSSAALREEEARNVATQQSGEQTAETSQPSLYLMDQALRNFSDEEKTALLRAEEECPDLVDKQIFLEDGTLHPEAAARKLCLYWEKRLELFGPTRAFLPLDLHDDGDGDGGGALRDDDLHGFRTEFCRRLPDDGRGRAVFFSDPTRYTPSKRNRASALRAQWYLLEEAARESDGNNGAVFVVFVQNVDIDDVDRKIARAVFAMDEYLPLRIRAYHFVHPPWYFGLARPVISYTMGKRNRLRCRVHTGSRDEVLESLGKFGMNRCHLPTSIGGEWKMEDIDEWIKERKTDRRNR